MADLRLAFRVDASLQIGTGHVARCLALADHMRGKGATSHFVCRSHVGHLRDAIIAKGYGVTMLELRHQSAQGSPPDYSSWVGAPQEVDAAETKKALADYSADWIIVDHYGLDAIWESVMRPAGRIMGIDDLANRKHECDILLDQGPGRAFEDYDGLVPNNAVRLIGPTYALLRREFGDLRASSLRRRRSGRGGQILVSFGGVDEHDATGRVLQALSGCDLPAHGKVVVAIGASAPWRSRVESLASSLAYDCKVLVGSNDLAEVMAQSDVSIGAGGGMALERCCMGLPTILVVLAENQREGAEALARSGAVVGPISPEQISSHLCALLESLQLPEVLESCGRRASDVTDGRGCERVARQILGGRAVDV